MNTLRIALVALLATFALRAGADPIHDAAKGNDVGKIKTLLNASPGAIKATDPFGRSPLGVAAHNGGKEAAAQAGQAARQQARHRIVDKAWGEGMTTATNTATYE